MRDQDVLSRLPVVRLTCREQQEARWERRGGQRQRGPLKALPQASQMKHRMSGWARACALRQSAFLEARGHSRRPRAGWDCVTGLPHSRCLCGWVYSALPVNEQVSMGQSDGAKQTV